MFSTKVMSALQYSGKSKSREKARSFLGARFNGLHRHLECAVPRLVAPDEPSRVDKRSSLDPGLCSQFCVPERAPVCVQLEPGLELLVPLVDGHDAPHAVRVGKDGKEDLALDALFLLQLVEMLLEGASAARELDNAAARVNLGVNFIVSFGIINLCNLRGVLRRSVGLPIWGRLHVYESVYGSPYDFKHNLHSNQI
jgi:hypothetical protein